MFHAILYIYDSHSWQNTDQNTCKMRRKKCQLEVLKIRNKTNYTFFHLIQSRFAQFRSICGLADILPLRHSSNKYDLERFVIQNMHWKVYCILQYCSTNQPIELFIFYCQDLTYTVVEISISLYTLSQTNNLNWKYRFLCTHYPKQII